ncbi:MAG: VWA domain-containing protein, partial [Bacteroidales bacterium]
MVLVLLILALARPQSSFRTHETSVEGIDIVIALDISGSMLAEDFRPNRMESAKQTARAFIDKRGGDRIGMTVFSGQSFTLCPLTTDHTLLKELINGVTPGMVEDGTAIGDG